MKSRTMNSDTAAAGERSSELLDCPNCPNQGWYMSEDGSYQEQCEFCYTEPMSVFNYESNATHDGLAIGRTVDGIIGQSHDFCECGTRHDFEIPPGTEHIYGCECGRLMCHRTVPNDQVMRERNNQNMDGKTKGRV